MLWREAAERADPEKVARMMAHVEAQRAASPSHRRSAAEIAAEFEVPRPTVYRALEVPTERLCVRGVFEFSRRTGRCHCADHGQI